MAVAPQVALAVDDEAAFLEIVSVKLEAVGFTVHTANSAAEGFEKARTLMPQIVLSDVYMPPGPNGWELGLQLRQDEATRHIPLALFTSLQDPWSEFPGGRNVGEKLLDPIAILSKTNDVEHLGEKVLKLIA